MSAFTEKEIQYTKGERLGRLATVDAEGRLHVAPVGIGYNAGLDTVDIGGHGLARSKKFVVDDVFSPWRARGIEIRGRAEVFSEGGTEVMASFSGELIRIFPHRIVGWGLDSDAFEANSRSVN